ncbi:MAG: Phosphatidylserine decarboxylase proenzyme [Pseudomonadota bacterium]|jgi:phosphatidylserine decarboxylase
MHPKVFIVAQYLIPQALLSRLIGWVARCPWGFIKNRFIEKFIQRYNVDMAQALEENPRAYKHFNAFFTRALKPGARPICEGEHTLACPADGAISQLGEIKNGRIFQAKGQEFSLLELLGGQEDLAAAYQDGLFATVYLSPKDYHRVHMPQAGELVRMVHIPGDLFSVNAVTAEQVPRLFARNERVVCHFSTPHGPMAVVLVGAMIVASIETPWAGVVAPTRNTVRTTHYGTSPTVTLEKGAEMGRFLLGSTAIVLLPKSFGRWREDLQAGSPVVMGERLADRGKA